MPAHIITTVQEAELLSHALRETSGIRKELRWDPSQDHLIRPHFTSRPPELGVSPQAIWQEPSDHPMEDHGSESNYGDDEEAEGDDDQDYEDDDDSEYDSNDHGDFPMEGPSSSTSTRLPGKSQPIAHATASRRHIRADPSERRAKLVAAYVEAAIGNESDPFSVLCLVCEREVRVWNTTTKYPGRRYWNDARWTGHLKTLAHVSLKENWTGATSD